MPKVLEDSLGNLQYLMAALTLLGVMYLCYKQARLHLDVSNAASKGASAGAVSRQGFDVAANTMRFYGGRRTDPGFGLSGFAGSLNAGPEFWATATEMDQLAGIANDQDNVDEVNETTFHDRANRNWVNDAVSKKPVVWTTEGYNSYRVPRRAGMKNPLAKALRSL